jgi:hypothetical protein
MTTTVLLMPDATPSYTGATDWIYLIQGVDANRDRKVTLADLFANLSLPIKNSATSGIFYEAALTGGTSGTLFKGTSAATTAVGLDLSLSAGTLITATTNSVLRFKVDGTATWALDLKVKNALKLGDEVSATIGASTTLSDIQTMANDDSASQSLRAQYKTTVSGTGNWDESNSPTKMAENIWRGNDSGALFPWLEVDNGTGSSLGVVTSKFRANRFYVVGVYNDAGTESDYGAIDVGADGNVAIGTAEKAGCALSFLTTDGGTSRSTALSLSSTTATINRALTVNGVLTAIGNAEHSFEAYSETVNQTVLTLTATYNNVGPTGMNPRVKFVQNNGWGADATIGFLTFTNDGYVRADGPTSGYLPFVAGALFSEQSDSGTTNSLCGLNVRHYSSGASGAGFGSHISFMMKDSSATEIEQARIAVARLTADGDASLALKVSFGSTLVDGLMLDPSSATAETVHVLDDTIIRANTSLKLEGGSSTPAYILLDDGDSSIHLGIGGSSNVTLTASAFGIFGTSAYARPTTYAAMTGAANRGAIWDTATITTEQLAQRVMAMQADLTGYGFFS